MILLVRHARPAASAAVPASRWPLTAEGLADAAALAERLAPLAGPGAVLVASDEPKAWQTLGPLAAALGRSPSEVVRDNRFGEVRRPEESWDDAWRERRRGWVEGADRPGWEGRADVAARFDGALAEHLAPAGAGTGGAGAAAGDGHLVVGSHGMVLTCWLASRGLVGPDDAGAFWSDLRLPDAFAVDLAAGTVRRSEDGPVDLFCPAGRRAMIGGWVAGATPPPTTAGRARERSPCCGWPWWSSWSRSRSARCSATTRRPVGTA